MTLTCESFYFQQVTHNTYSVWNRLHNIGTTAKRLRWYGHVLQKEHDDCVKECMEYEVDEQRVQDQEGDQRGPGERLWNRTVKHVN